MKTTLSPLNAPAANGALESYLKAISRFGLKVFLLFSLAVTAFAEQAQQVSQYGITWKFDKPCTVGKFVTGDWWVIGPVTVVSVDPKPEPAPKDAKTGEVKSRYGTTAMVDDERMRNGSMIVLKEDEKQGYDSRLKNYNPDLSVKFPCPLVVNRSLISTISNTSFPVPVFLSTPPASYMKGTDSMALKTAAVLTCLDKAPPYGGTEKPIYLTKNIQWNLLPNLTPVKNVPPWDLFERFFQRPWLEHIDHWVNQFTGPNENQVNYGREVARINATASLMLMLNVPQERKQKLMQGLVQYGIDLYGMARCGRHWRAETAPWNGRKWPILFAGLMLGDKEMQALPGNGKTVFLEDANSYYGKGWFGDAALYQMCFWSGARFPHEEKDPSTWDAADGHNEMYRGTTAGAQVCTALPVLLMKAKALWNHDAFFDLCDRWMNQPDPVKNRDRVPHSPRPVLYPLWGKTCDPFTDEMWVTYRKQVPEQPGGTRNLKWVWDLPENKGTAGDMPEFLRPIADRVKECKELTLKDVPDLAWSAWTVNWGAWSVTGHYVPNPKPGNPAANTPGGKSK